ncbi:MAG TPA: MlaD family protein [Bacteroidales bacterium]|jgi:phospholipid/cholesterol/gamma-HCH transport system substrate-binding protein|nr:MlaD family protein [Bacteroidales bacterium]
MKKISNEVKVGVIALITIIVFIWLYNFLKGNNLLNKDAVYFSVYDKVGGLAESSPVEVNGFRVGVVQSIKFITPESGRLLVTFSVDRNFKIPAGTVAEIVPVSVLGGMKVQFVYGEGPGFYKYDDTIPGRVAANITDMLESELIPVKDKISHLITEIDSVISSVNQVMNPEFRKNLGTSLSHINNMTGSLDNIIGSRQEELKNTLESLRNFSKMLSDNTVKMDATFSNLKNITDTLSAADIYGTVAGLKASLEQTKTMIDNLNKGKGSAGQLLTNDSVYINLNSSLKNLSVLLDDLKANPKRYVHFSVFGRKNIPSQ